MMKKFLSLLLAAMLLMSCVSAFAADEDYKYNADQRAITKYSGSETDLVIPAQIGGEPVISLYSDALGSSVLKKLNSLTLSEGVKQLRDSNTYSAKVLTKVTLPETLEMIGRRNFYQADALTEITIPAAVAYVGQECFSYCDALVSITFTGVCPVIAERNFLEPAASLVVYVPDDQLDAYKAALPEGLNVQPSGKNATVVPSGVAESDFTVDAATGAVTGYTGTSAVVEIPATIGGVQVKSIGLRAFLQNPYVVIVTLPEGLEAVEDGAFNGAKALARVNFPSTIKTIGKAAFNAVKLDKLSLPEGLETIGDSAFSNAFGLNRTNEVVIPNSVTTIGAKALQSCTSTKIVIGENVQTIGSQAFAMCNNLTEIVVLSKNAITIAEDTFNKCSKECVLSLPEGVSEEVYNGYVSALAVQFPTCKVEMPAPPAPAVDTSALLGEWYGVYGDVFSMTDDGMIVYMLPDGNVRMMDWAVVNGTVQITSGNWMGATVAIDANGALVVSDSVLNEVFTRTAPSGGGDFEIIAATAEQFVGGWICEDLGASVVIDEGGQAALIQGDEAYFVPWTLSEGILEMDGMMFALTTDGRMAMDSEDMIFFFVRGDVEVPEAPAAAMPVLDASAEPYIGKWNADTMEENGMETPAAMLNLTSSIELNADGTALMTTFSRDMFDGDPTYWCVQDGQIYVGLSIDQCYTINPLDDGRLCYNMNGTIFKYVKEGAQAPAATTDANEIPAASAGGSKVDVNDPSTYVGKTFKCVSIVMDGTPMDMASMAASLITFNDNGMADVTIQGYAQSNQPYMAGNMGGVDTIMVTYMGYTQLMYNIGETGLDLNYMGMMDMHFEAQ